MKLRLSNTLYRLNEVTIGLITGFSNEIIGDLNQSSFGEVWDVMGKNTVGVGSRERAQMSISGRMDKSYVI